MRIVPIGLILILTSTLGPASGAERLVLVAGGAGAPAGAKLTSPFGVAFSPSGELIFVEMTGHRVGRIDGRGLVTTIAGTGRKGSGGDGGPATGAELNSPHGLAIAPDGGILVADTWNNRVRRIDPRTGRIATIAGTGRKGFGGDGGPATAAEFGGVYGFALDPAGTRLYVADLDNLRVRALDLATGLVTTAAGDGTRGVPADGAPARSAPLLDPRAVAADGAGNLYILERSGHALRVVGRDGIIRTVAGTGKAGATGDGGPARLATLNGPKHLCIDRDGGVLIADTENHLIRKYRPSNGTIVRIAGTGRKGADGVGGPPDRARLSQPHGVAVHPSGEIYIADSSNDRILRIGRGDGGSPAGGER